MVGAGILALNQIQVSSIAEFDITTNIDRRYISIGGLESHVITAIDVPNKVLTLQANVNRVYKTNPVGSTLVYAIRAISYQVSGGTLLRDDHTGQSLADRSLADNIEALQFAYFKDDGITQTANPPEIRNIQVTLRARTNDSDPAYKNDGGYRKRTIASNVRLRNMGL
jgi:hypothetical protein